MQPETDEEKRSKAIVPVDLWDAKKVSEHNFWFFKEEGEILDPLDALCQATQQLVFQNILLYFSVKGITVFQPQI